MAGLPGAVGKTAASAGRSTPGTAPRTIFAVAMAAPVLPAVTKPEAWPSRAIRRPTRMEESRLARIASPLSSMVMYSLAWTISIGRRAAAEWRSSSALTIASGPTSTTRTPYWRAAWIAPSISGLGARSEPIASSAMTLGMVYELAGFFDVENFASLIVSALGAGAVRHFLFVTVGALGKAMALQSIVGAPRGGALLGVATFWIRHGG